MDTPLGQVGPPIEIEISFPSRYMTFTSSLLARGSLYRSSSLSLSFFFYIQSSVFLHDSLWYPMKRVPLPTCTVEPYNPRSRHSPYVFSPLHVSSFFVFLSILSLSLSLCSGIFDAITTKDN